MEMLRVGTRGRHVRRWQTFLIDRGFLAGRADGIFGPLTRAATIAFQHAHGLAEDGIVGPQTAAVADWLVEKPPIQHLETPTEGPTRPSVTEEPEDESAAQPSPPPSGKTTVLTDVALRQIMPRLGPSGSKLYAPFLQRAMEEFGIDTPARAAAFLAQLAHESGQLRFMEEIWGPTPAQRRYEPRSRLAARLGNAQPGDGKRFKGRGPIQLTGRANYGRYGTALGIDLTANPELAATKEVGFRIAGLFWKRNGLNQLADAQRFKAITRRINGGFNGLADRLEFYRRAKGVFGVPSIRGVEPAVAAAPLRLPRGLDAPGEITPTAAERSPRRRGGRGARRVPAKPRKKRTTRKPAARATTRKRRRPRAAAARKRGKRQGTRKLRRTSARA
jgi:putative chitinase